MLNANDAEEYDGGESSEEEQSSERDEVDSDDDEKGNTDEAAVDEKGNAGEAAVDVKIGQILVEDDATLETWKKRFNGTEGNDKRDSIDDFGYDF